jgi:hypothetical protein
MKLFTSNFIVITAAFLVACGGGSEEDNEGLASQPINSQPDSSTLLAADIFDFRIDRDIVIVLTNRPNGHGFINVYHGTSHYDSQNNIYYPDGDTFLTSWQPDNIDQISVAFNKNWSGLLFEWQPSTGQARELYIYYPASQLSDTVYVTL